MKIVKRRAAGSDQTSAESRRGRLFARRSRRRIFAARRSRRPRPRDWRATKAATHTTVVTAIRRAANTDRENGRRSAPSSRSRRSSSSRPSPRPPPGAMARPQRRAPPARCCPPRRPPTPTSRNPTAATARPEAVARCRASAVPSAAHDAPERQHRHTANDPWRSPTGHIRAITPGRAQYLHAVDRGDEQAGNHRRQRQLDHHHAVDR